MGGKEGEFEEGRTNLVDLGQSLHVGTVQHPQRQADHLQILAAGGRGDVPRLGPDVEDDAPLQPGHEEVRPLVHDLLLQRDKHEDAREDYSRQLSVEMVCRAWTHIQICTIC